MRFYAPWLCSLGIRLVPRGVVRASACVRALRYCEGGGNSGDADVPPIEEKRTIFSQRFDGKVSQDVLFTFHVSVCIGSVAHQVSTG